MMKVYLEPHEVKTIEEQAACIRDRLLIKLLFRLGCRISEALALRVGDIDFTRGTVTILHLKSRRKLSCSNCKARLGKTHAFCPRCGLGVRKAVVEEKEHRRMRTLPLDKETLDLLADFIGCGDPKGHIFSINRHRAWQIVRDCAQRAGLGKLASPESGRLRNVSPHRLRDAFAVHAMKLDDSGDGLRLLQEHLGHTSFNTTARYRKIAGEELKAWYEKLWKSEAT